MPFQAQQQTCFLSLDKRRTLQISNKKGETTAATTAATSTVTTTTARASDTATAETIATAVKILTFEIGNYFSKTLP